MKCVAQLFRIVIVDIGDSKDGFLKKISISGVTSEGNFLLSSELRQRNETTKKTNRCERRSDGGDFAENGEGKKIRGAQLHFAPLSITSERLENVVRPPAGRQKLLWREIPPSCMN